MAGYASARPGSQGERLVRDALGVGEGVARRHRGVEAEHRPGVRQPRVRQREARIPRQRLLEVLHAEPEVRLGAAIPEVAALEVEPVRLDVVGRRLGSATRGSGSSSRSRSAPPIARAISSWIANTSSASRSKLSDHRRNPSATLMSWVETRSREPRPAHAALQHGAHLEPAPDLARVLGSSLEGEARGARDHVQARAPWPAR